MKVYNEVCPNCGTLNYHLDLDETGGVYECECCKQIIKSKTYGMDFTVLPLFDLSDSIDQVRLANFCKKKEMLEFKFRKIEVSK